MQAEGIRTGDRYDEIDDQGRVIGGWTATGDAVVTDGTVHVPVKYRDDGTGTRVWDVGQQVPLSWGVGPKYPLGTPEYDAYAAELRAELAKFVAPEVTGYPGAARDAGFGL